MPQWERRTSTPWCGAILSSMRRRCSKIWRAGTPGSRYLFARLRNTAYAVVDQIAEEMRCSDFVPLAFELSFGERGELPAVTVSEPDAELRIGGKVDRVDGWVKDNRLYLRVVDYKSGKKAFDLAAVRMGLDIQMLLYLFALKKEGKQRFGMDIEPAGVLYLPAGMRFSPPSEISRRSSSRASGRRSCAERACCSLNRRCSRPWSTRLCKVPGSYRCG